MATYNHEWDIGSVSATVSAVSAMAALQSKPNDIFPFTVKGRSGATSIKVSEIYDLIDTLGTFDNWGQGPDPVQVSVATPDFLHVYYLVWASSWIRADHQL